MSEGGGASWTTGEAYAKLMEGWNQAFREAAGKAGFAESSETFLNAFVEQQAVRAEMLEQWANAMQELAGTDAFAAASGQLLALYAQQVQALRAASRATAETLQIATTEDLAATSQLVVNVERKLDEATDQLAAVSGRLDAIESTLRDLAARAATPPPAAPTPSEAAEPAAPAAAAAKRSAAAKRTARRRTSPPSAD
jgi:chromosome segregation ATPase